MTDATSPLPEAYRLTAARDAIAVDAALRLLRTTYWAAAMTRESLARAMSGSMCFGVLLGDDLVGFARVITDRATFAYLTDVVIAPSHQHRGLGARLTEYILAHPDLQGIRRFSLLTKDAMAFYARFGFVEGAGGLAYMERR